MKINENPKFFYIIVGVVAGIVSIILVCTDLLEQPSPGVMAAVVGGVVSAITPTLAVIWASVYSPQGILARQLSERQLIELEKEELNNHFRLLKSEIFDPIRNMVLEFQPTRIGKAFGLATYHIDDFPNKIVLKMGKDHISQNTPEFENTVKEVKDLIIQHNEEVKQLYDEVIDIIRIYVNDPKNKFSGLQEKSSSLLLSGEVSLTGTKEAVDLLWERRFGIWDFSKQKASYISEETIKNGIAEELGIANYARLSEVKQIQYAQQIIIGEADKKNLTFEDFAKLLGHCAGSPAEIDKIRKIYKIREEVKAKVGVIQKMVKILSDQIDAGIRLSPIDCCKEIMKRT